MNIGKTGVALLTACALVLGTSAMPAFAGEYHRGGGYHDQHRGGGYHRGGKGYYKGGKGYHKGHRRHHRKKNKDWVPFAVIGGIAAVAIIASQANKKKKHHGGGYYNDGGHGGYHKASGGENCQLVYKTERVRGRNVKKGCTLCYNPDGSAYIVEGSEFTVGYVD